MLSLNMILHALRGYIINQKLHFTPEKPFLQSYVLEGRAVDSELMLYIGTPDAFVTSVDLADPKGQYTIILAGTSPSVAPYLEYSNLNIIITSLSLARLCNLVYQACSEYGSWISSMERHLYMEPNMKDLVECGSEILQANVYLLDAGYKSLCAGTPMKLDTPFLNELEEKEYLSYESILELTGQEEGMNKVPGWNVLSLPGGSYHVILYPIQYNINVVSHLLIILPDSRYNPAVLELVEQFRTYVTEFILKYNNEKYETGNRVSALMGDLIEQRVTGMDELLDRLKQLPIHIKKYYYPIVIEFEELLGKSPLAHFLSELERIFPTDLITTYKGDILVLVWKTKHYAPMEYDKEAFIELLERYQAYASIGNFTKWLTSLRPLYLQAKGIIKYARVFRQDPNERLFRFEQYSMYHIVGLCVDYCGEFHGGDPVYLCHQGIIALSKYDQKYETNLCAILKYYLMNDRCMASTARNFYLHRNTLQNRIDKIEELIGESLDNEHIRQRLLFSLLVLEYMQKYLRREDVYGKNRYKPPTVELVSDK